jgi:hypothetical protein
MMEDFHTEADILSSQEVVTASAAKNCVDQFEILRKADNYNLLQTAAHATTTTTSGIVLLKIRH